MVQPRRKPILGWMLQLLGVLFLLFGLLFSITLVGGCVAMPMVFMGFPILALGRKWVDEGRGAKAAG